MYYFIDKEDVIEKYLVCFSKDKVEKLKLDIINNCSEIVHHEYEGSRGPNKFDYLRIRNYKEKFLRCEESRDSLQWPDQDIYLFSYDEYKEPELVLIIDELLKGNIKALDFIFNENIDIKIDSIDERIKKISNEIDAIDNFKISKKKEKLDELQKLIELKEINKNQESIIPYYDKLKKLITLDLVDTITKDEINRVNNFFGNTTSFKKIHTKKLYIK